MDTNILYYGDNLDILQGHIPDESVDLIYLDPPFNSRRQYNVLFKERSGTPSSAQIRAFSDTWHWDRKAEAIYQDVVVKAPLQVSKAIEALREFIGSNDVMAYLVMMTVRLVELHRALKSTGSLYLHCDPTASHYLKVILDTIFGTGNFRNEILWKRTSAHGDSRQGSKHFGRVHDTILRYSKSEGYVWNQQYVEYDREYVEAFYRHTDPETGRKYRLDNLTASRPGGDTLYEWKGVRPYRGRYWAYSRKNMEKFEREGRLIYSQRGFPQYKRYLDEMPGMPVQDVWVDIPPALGKERLGYQTQKPMALLERIVKASSNEGDVVLDPFCGCGTAVIAAQKLNRRWIGIDITHLSITVMRKRLEDSFPALRYDVVGEPKDMEGAQALARQDRYQFQWWALSLVNALPQSGQRKKGADEGIDGVISFLDDNKGKARRVIVQVKSGRVGVKDIREMKTVMGDDNLGLFITLRPPTEPMRVQAVTAGVHYSPLWNRDFPRLQIFTIEELLSGSKLDLPRESARVRDFNRAPRLQDNGSQMSIAELEEAYKA